jgi:hypothetical protein
LYDTFFCREKVLPKATTNANFRRDWRTGFPAWLVCAQVKDVFASLPCFFGVYTERGRSIKGKKNIKKV